MMNRTEYPRVEQDPNGNIFVHYGTNAVYRVSENMFNVEQRIKEMDRARVDFHVITLNIPGVDRLEPESGIKLSRLVNDDFAKLANRYPERFVAFATLPLQVPDLALDELRRAIDDLGLKGLMLYSNVNGKPLDAPEFYPIYAECSKKGIPIFLHPTYPANNANLMDYCLIPVVGFLFETTIAILRLIQGGILEKYPNLKIVMGHLGATVPYLMGRIDYESNRLPGCNVKISKLPSYYFKQIYIDTVSAHKPAMAAALSFPGIERIVFGSDFPFWPAEETLALIESLDISSDQKEQIFSGNARNVLNI